MVRKRQPVQFFKRSVYSTAYLTATSAGAFGSSKNFKLTDVPNATEFTNLYDQYQIKGIKITLIPRANSADVINGSLVQPIGNLWSVIDYDDGTAPTTIDTVLQYPNLKRTQMVKSHSRYFKPKYVQQLYSSAAVVGYGNAHPNSWIDCNSSAVEHYGLKFWVDLIPTVGTTIQYDAHIIYYLAFKNVR